MGPVVDQMNMFSQYQKDECYEDSNVAFTIRD